MQQIDDKVKQYIQNQYPEYDTITTLKDDAIDENYKSRIEKEVNNIYNMFYKQKDR